MKLNKSNIDPNSSIIINFAFPPINTSNKEKIYRLIRNLNISDNKSSINIIIEIIFVIYPIQIFFSSEKYSLTFDNQQYKLNATKLLKGEIIKFKIENNFKQIPFQLQFSITSLEKNTNDEPMIEIKNSNEFNIIIQNNNNNIENVDILNCLIDIYITEEIKISILIDSLIISTYFNFYIYDYETKNFVDNKMDIYIPSFENECEIELHFLVNTFIESNIIGIFNISEISEGVTIINHSKEIKINSYENYFSIKLKFNLSKFFDNEIATFEFKINNLSKKIKLFQKNQSIKYIDLKLIKI